MLNSVVAQPDFEQYARIAPHIEDHFAFTPACDAAMSKASGTFVDLGAGDGAVLRSAFRQGRLERFARIIATDVSTLRMARLKSEHLPRVEAVVAGASALPLPNASVDFLFSHQVIEHVPSDNDMAGEIARVLKPGCSAFVSSVSKRWYGWYFYRCNGRFRLDPTHVREYRNVRELASLFEAHGLNVTSEIDRSLGHPLDKIALHVLLRLKLLAPQRSSAFFASNGVLRALRGRELRIPGYRYAEVVVTRPDIER